MKSCIGVNSSVRHNFRNAILLVIEDNADHRTIINRAIQLFLPEVKTVLVPDEGEAVAYLNSCSLQEWELPKLILLDLYLPDRKNGWQVLNQVRTMPSEKGKIPVVVFSHSNDRDDVTEAYKRGCSSYLVKPARFADWQHCLENLRSYWWETVTLPRMSTSVF